MWKAVIAAVVLAGQLWTVEKTAVGCKDRGDVELILSAVRNRETQLVEQLLTNGLLLGMCEEFEEGDEVVPVDVEDVYEPEGIVQVRRPNSAELFWIPVRALFEE